MWAELLRMSDDMNETTSFDAEVFRSCWLKAFVNVYTLSA